MCLKDNNCVPSGISSLCSVRVTKLISVKTVDSCLPFTLSRYSSLFFNEINIALTYEVGTAEAPLAIFGSIIHRQ
jgi:hypothetical protein